MKPIDWDLLGNPIFSPLDVAIAAIPLPTLPPMLCKCPDTYTKVLGDGCDICNPELAKEMK